MRDNFHYQLVFLNYNIVLVYNMIEKKTTRLSLISIIRWMQILTQIILEIIHFDVQDGDIIIRLIIVYI